MNNIIEVYRAEASLLKEAWYQKVAVYTLEKEGFNLKLIHKLQKYAAVILRHRHDEIVIQKRAGMRISALYTMNWMENI
jgi:hypothetical protein